MTIAETILTITIPNLKYFNFKGSVFFQPSYQSLFLALIKESGLWIYQIETDCSKQITTNNKHMGHSPLDQIIHFLNLCFTLCFCNRVSWFFSGATWLDLPQDADLLRAKTIRSLPLIFSEKREMRLRVSLQSSSSSSAQSRALKSGGESACWSDSPITNEKRHGSDSKINEVSRAALAWGALGLFLQRRQCCLTAIYGDK